MLIIEDDPYYFLQFDKVQKSSPSSSFLPLKQFKWNSGLCYGLILVQTVSRYTVMYLTAVGSHVSLHGR